MKPENIPKPNENLETPKATLEQASDRPITMESAKQWIADRAAAMLGRHGSEQLAQQEKSLKIDGAEAVEYRAESGVDAKLAENTAKVAVLESETAQDLETPKTESSENLYIQPQGIWKSEGQKPLEGIEKHKGMGDRVEYLINQEFLDPQGSGRRLLREYFQVDPELMKPEEQEVARRFFGYAAKRILNAEIEKEVALTGDSEVLKKLQGGYATRLQDVLKFPQYRPDPPKLDMDWGVTGRFEDSAIEVAEYTKQYGERAAFNSMVPSLLTHDTAHVFGEILQGKKSLASPFFRYQKNQENNKTEVVESEIYAALFQSEEFSPKEILFDSSGTRKAWVDRFSKESKITESDKQDFSVDKITSFEVFQKFFCTKVLRDVIRYENAESAKSLVGEANNGLFYQEPFDKLMKEYDRVAGSIIANPPAKLTECLRYVWDHQKNLDGTPNERVLVDLFMTQMRDINTRLATREERRGIVT